MNPSEGGELEFRLRDNLAVQYQIDGARKVYDRFILNEFSDNPVDFEQKTIETLGLVGIKGSEVIADVGTADGHFLQLLRLYGHTGELIGIEPNTQQFEHAPLWQPLDPDPLLELIKAIHGPEAVKGFYQKLSTELATSLPDGIKLLEGHANYIPLPNQSVDVMSALFSFYHVDTEKQPQAFAEIKRVLKQEGVFVLTTSSQDNKLGHRIFERAIAKSLGVAKPPTMNSGFNTERAETELPKYFEYVYQFVNSATMLITNSDRLQAYLRSQRSLRDQYNPIPDEVAFERALNEIVASRIIALIKHGEKKQFTDIIRRSMFICSDRPLEPGADFERVLPTGT